MNRQNAPCYGCKDRYVGCHADCAKYEEYHNNSDVYREYVNRNKREYSEASGFHFNSPRPRVGNKAAYKRYGHR